MTILLVMHRNENSARNKDREFFKSLSENQNENHQKVDVNCDAEHADAGCAWGCWMAMATLDMLAMDMNGDANVKDVHASARCEWRRCICRHWI